MPFTSIVRASRSVSTPEVSSWDCTINAVVPLEARPSSKMPLPPAVEKGPCSQNEEVRDPFVFMKMPPVSALLSSWLQLLCQAASQRPPNSTTAGGRLT